VFNPASALTPELKDLHTYGDSFDTRWVTVHDTEVDGTAVFNANAHAKAKSATPFKRPENGLFRPGIGFREFYFTETGDTSATSTGNAGFGGFGGIYKLAQVSPTANQGKLTLFFKGDLEHTSFDNIAFWDANHVVAVEDRGDGLHAQANALDSGWLFDVRANFAGGAQPIRIIACGRDALATLDGGFAGLAGFQNEGDNEITGIHVSDGDPTIGGLLGVRAPRPFDDGWRVFWTQQHGENMTYEILEDSHEDHDHHWRFGW
jgi:secreted PhoX family phosphatase